ncbi:MAG: chorismate mutase AroQ, gamma subclass [Gammaproteobacteria bacterium]|nr:chorismate mutase AroQ, gamma subclass [Gammaproteobacteria bacterium]|tara:strand:+ start:1038 stop:1586 length:549 start_codon:yes stop_codon:yes gene_type:complete
MKIDYSIKYILLTICWSFLGISSAACASEKKIFHLINERLSYMEAVALYKSENKLPIDDFVREQIVIENATSMAADQGLLRDSVEPLFRAQIAVAKAIQYRSIADWISEPSTEQAPNLATEIRPILTELGDKIISALADFLKNGKVIQEKQRDSFHKIVTHKHINNADKDQLFNSLLLIRML